MTKATARDKRRTYSRDLGERMRLEAEVGPCVFMHRGYPLQITVTLHRQPDVCLGTAYAVDSTKTADTFTVTSVKRLLARVRICPCLRCSTPAFDPITVQTNRGGLCEPCFVAMLEAEWEV